jgi:phosphoribosylformylglycinamidine cyclo-ligase
MTNQGGAYARSGVNINAGNRAVELMSAAVKSTYGAEVLAGIGAFGGLFDIAALKTMEHPVLVASTDGVGTKTKVAAKLQRWNTIGQDLVNHCINDILVQGAKPLFFLDYIAMARLEPERVAAVVGGAASACKAAGIALLGGETAELPNVYHEGEIDVVGTIVGVVDKSRIINGARIVPGDVILNLPSSGLHTNGYSLARTALAHFDWTLPMDELGGISVGDALLATHRSYLHDVQNLSKSGVDIKGLAHITGGGVIENLPRILPEGTGAQIQRGTWQELPIFHLIQRAQQIHDSEMFRVFNMGLGMLVVTAPEVAAQCIAAVPDAVQVGVIVEGEREVVVQ